MQKQKPFRSSAYLSWVRGLPCYVSGRTEDIQAHHVRGLGGVMGGKVSDIFTIPLNSEVHALLHSNPEDVHIDELKACLETIEVAVKRNVLQVNPFEAWSDGF